MIQHCAIGSLLTRNTNAPKDASSTSTGGTDNGESVQQGNMKDFMLLLHGALNQRINRHAQLNAILDNRQKVKQAVNADALDERIAQLLENLKNRGLDVENLLQSFGQDLIQNLENIESLLKSYLPELPPEQQEALQQAIEGIEEFQAILAQHTQHLLELMPDNTPPEETLLTESPDTTENPENPETSEMPEILETGETVPSPSEGGMLPLTVSEPTQGVTDPMTQQPGNQTLQVQPSVPEGLDPQPIDKTGKGQGEEEVQGPAKAIALLDLETQEIQQTEITIQLRGHIKKLLEERQAANNSQAEQQAAQNKSDWLASLPPKAREVLQNVLEKIQNLPESGKLMKQLAEQFMAQQNQALQSRNTEKSIYQMALEVALEDKVSLEQPLAPDAALPVESVFTMPQPTDPNQRLMQALTRIAGQNTNPESPAQTAEPSPQIQVFDAIRSAMKAGQKEISLNLKPDSLGTIRMTLVNSMSNELTIRLVADNQMTRDMIESTLDSLIHSLESNGIQVGKISVVQAERASNEEASQQNSNPSHQGDQPNQDSRQTQAGHNHSNRQFSSDTHPGDLNAEQTDSTSTDGDHTSSTGTFDTDVEGEEVSTVINSDGSVDIRV